MTGLLWLRRDLRRADHPALVAAAAAGSVLPVVVIDPRQWTGAGSTRHAWYAASVLAAKEAYGGHLTILQGDPASVIPVLAQRITTDSVHVSAETTPRGAARDHRVRRALERAGVGLVETGSPYAVSPGRVRSQAGTPYRVFTPYHRAWSQHGWPRPARSADIADLAAYPDDEAALDLLRGATHAAGVPDLPPAGEVAANRRWRAFLERRLEDYPSARDRPDLPGTAQVSADLRVGALHPRTLLTDLAAIGGPAAAALARQLAWRDFYADVLHHHPDSAWHDFRPTLAALAHDEDPEALRAWQDGATGYPIVDAGMRQLRATGWMHNRVRMIVASFLTKDLHLPWQLGARHFLDHLIDGDLASNNHGWQWVAGTGTDAAPYDRVFNPTLQGQRFDPEGDYVRRWVPELAHLSGPAVHRPWEVLDGLVHGYPAPIVDHDEERREALARYAATRA